MNSDVVFKTPLSFTTTTDLGEAVNFLEENKVEEIPLFTESITHHYSPDNKNFYITANGEELNFTQPAYLEFCGHVGIPAAFAQKIPNDLLIQCVDEMLSDHNQKMRLLVRNKNVISGCKKDSFVAVNPIEFLESAVDLIGNHAFREANIGDEGTSMLFEPLQNAEISPTTGDVQDRFSIGVDFRFGVDYYGRAHSGLVSAYPYSMRHVCINVATTRANDPKYQLVESLTRKTNGASEFYNRLLENYTSDTYTAYMKELNERIERVAGKYVTDFEYDRTYSKLSRLLGKEVSLAVIGIDEAQHDEIMVDVKYRKKRNTLTKDSVTELEDLNMFELFNSITAAAKGYNGIDRSRLESIGGGLL